MKLKDALRLAEDLGLEVIYGGSKTCGDEVRIIRPGLPMIRVKGTRKDAPKNMVMHLRRAQGKRGTGWRAKG